MTSQAFSKHGNLLGRYKSRGDCEPLLQQSQRPELETLYPSPPPPDAVIVEDSRPGSTPKAQLEHGAAQLAAQGGRGLLISVVGIAKLMGAPLRALYPGDGLE